MLAAYKKEYGISFCGVRLCHTLGPGIVLDDGRGFAEFMDCVLNDHDIVLHSDGGAMRTYTYVADAINAIFLMLLDFFIAYWFIKYICTKFKLLHIVMGI